MQKQEDHTDTVDRAWGFVTGWTACNKKKFSSGIYEPPENYGTIENGVICVICSVLNQALEEAGYSYRKCIHGFGKRGHIRTSKDADGKMRSQVLKRVKGIPRRVYVLEISEDEQDDKPALAD